MTVRIVGGLNSGAVAATLYSNLGCFNETISGDVAPGYEDRGGVKY